MIESIEDITYDGVRLSDLVQADESTYILVNYVGGRSLPNIRYRTTEIDLSREYFSGLGVGPREIYADITIKGRSYTDVRRIIDRLSSELVRDVDVPITFEDEPGLTYYGRYVGASETLENSKIAQVRVNFLCVDGRKYSSPIYHNASADPYMANEGTSETYPEIELKVKEDITEVAITNFSIPGNPSILLGKPASIEDTVYQPEQLAFQDSMQSTSSWQQASTVDVGYVAGRMAVDSEGFYSEDYGENISNFNWQGPSLQKGLGTTLNDFRAEFKVISRALPKGSGMIDIYLRDANGNLIVKVGIGDYWQDKAQNYTRMQLGTFETGWKKEFHPTKNDSWVDFDGILRVERKGNTYEFYFAQIDKNGRHYNVPPVVKYTDTSGRYSAPISTVQVGFRKNTAYPTRIKMRVKEIKIYALNRPPNPSGQVPLIGSSGDVININTRTSEVIKNGEYANELIDLKSEFFPLVRGYNHIAVSPPDGVTANVKFRRVYL